MADKRLLTDQEINNIQGQLCTLGAYLIQMDLEGYIQAIGQPSRDRAEGMTRFQYDQTIGKIKELRKLAEAALPFQEAARELARKLGEKE